jgi:hypothetical protein
LVEVGVPVQEQQSVPAESPEGECIAEQDAAVATEYDRELAPPNYRSNCIGEGKGVVAKPDGVEHSRHRVDHWIERRSRKARREASVKPLRESRGEECIRELLHTGRPQAEMRRCLNDRETWHLRTL